jgi:hypothetical protein
VKKGVIPEALFSSEIDGLKDLEDLILVEKPDQGFLSAFLWDIKYPIGQFPVFRALESQHFGKGFEGSQALIAGFGKIFALPFKSIEERQDKVRGKMLYPERSDCNVVIRGREGQKEPEGIPIGFDGMGADPFDMGKVLIEEPME